MPKKDKIPEKNESVIFREIEGENVLIPIARSYSLIFYSLNKTGKFIWEQINGKMSEEEIASLLCEQYNVSQETACRDIRGFMDTLYKNKLISF